MDLNMTADSVKTPAKNGVGYVEKLSFIIYGMIL